MIEPTDKSSHIFRFANKGGGLHHLCFKCKDMDDEIDAFKIKRLRILNYLQPGEAFENEDIAFIYAKQGLNIELIATDKKGKIIKQI